MEKQKVLSELLVQSPCNKRKVAAIIVDKNDNIIAKGFNYNPNKESCEDNKGNTYQEVIHAEVAAINNLGDKKGKIMYVTHYPCDNCKEAINKANLTFEVVDMFIKFDNGKLRYSLIPPHAMEELAKVLTYGAKKYKPNNWRKVKDLSRYEDALFRHLQEWRKGNELDKESKLPHLSHALANIVFLIELNKYSK